MNDSKIKLDSTNVKNCWLKIKSGQGTDFFVNEFYKLLFEQHPEIEQLFPEKLIQQKSKLLNMLDNVINGIEYISELESILIELGQHHKDIGVTKEMFDIFISAVIEAANSSSSYRLTEKESAAWKDAFTEISKTLLKAYSQ